MSTNMGQLNAGKREIIPLFSVKTPMEFSSGSSIRNYGSLSSQLGSTMTITMWINSKTTSGTLLTFGRSVSNYDGEFFLFINSSGFLTFWDYTYANGYGFNGSSNIPIPLNKDIHIAFVKNRYNGTFYINGKNAGQISSLNYILYNNNNLVLGMDPRGDSGETGFNGIIHDFNIYSSALTPTQINSIYNNEPVFIEDYAYEQTVESDNGLYNLQSNVMKLETLESTFKSKLTEYQQAYTDYVSSFSTFNAQSKGYDGEENVDVPGNDISSSPSSGPQECQTRCNANDNCVGIALRKSDNYCWLKNKFGAKTVNTDRNIYLKRNSYTAQLKTNAGGNDISDYGNTSVEACQSLCDSDKSCVGIVTRSADTHCWLKNNVSSTNPEPETDVYVKGGGVAGYSVQKNTDIAGGPNDMYAGTGGVDACSSQCDKDQKCGGFAYQASSGGCWFKGSMTSTYPHNTIDSYTKPNSRVPPDLTNIKMLNDELIQLSSQINDMLTTIQPSTSYQRTGENIYNAQLLKQDALLLAEREKIKEMIAEYEDLSEEYQDNTLSIVRSNYMFVLWSIIAIIFIIISIRFVL
jgi:hypothetical protein